MSIQRIFPINNQKKLGYNTIFSLVYMEIIKNFLVLIVVVVDS